MSQFAPEALFAGVKEGVKFSISVFLVLSYFRNAGFDRLRKAFFAAIAVAFAASLAVAALPSGNEIRDAVAKSIGYSFGLFYLFSLAALLHETGTDILGPLVRVFQKNIVLVPLVFLLTLVYAVPDMAGASLYISDLYWMRSRSFTVFLQAGTGTAAALSAFFFLGKRVGGTVRVARLIGLPQMLLFLALIKLLAGGVRGFTEFSLIPSVQAGLMKLIHDVVHQTFVTIMVPDHPILTTTAWNFIGVLFGETPALWLALIVLVLPLIIFIKRHFSGDAEAPAALQTAASKRLFIKAFRSARLLRSIPIFVFLAVIIGMWFTERSGTMNSLYDPEPKPAAAAGGIVAIPLSVPGQDLLDGRLHKFSIAVNGETYRLLVIRKPGGALSVCLDACEICRPEGYAEGRGYLVCLYCRTPIPLETAGRPGGCNPIPLAALVTEKEIRIPLSELEKMWKTVNSVRSEESGGK